MFNSFFQNQYNNIGHNNLFSLFEQMGNIFPGEDQPHQQRRGNKPPPASKRAIDNLPVVQITADDLIEETNKECLICLESHTIGMMSTKLPCGHLFHKPCLAEWLVKQCTCPVCRYELETEDAQFEASRKLRMKERKLRFRKDELKNQSIHQLKEICTKLSISTIGCIDKQEIVDKIIRSGKVIVTDGIPPIEITEEDFNSKNVSELKHLLLSFGLSSTGALEKSDLRNRLIESGRIVIVTSNPSSSSNIMEVEEPKPKTPTKGGDDINSQLKGSNSNGKDGNYISYSREELKNMSLSGLRELCRRYHINTTSCLDKSEVIDCMIHSNNFPVKRDSTIESNSYKEHDLNLHSLSSSSQPSRSRTNSQHRSSPSNVIRSRSGSHDPASSRKRSLSTSSNNSHNDPTVIMPPYAHTVNLQEPNYSPPFDNSDYYNTEPLDQAINYIGHFIQSTATDLSSQFQTMYHQTQSAGRSRSSSNATSTPPVISTSRVSNSTNSTPRRSQNSSSRGSVDETREKLVLSRELLESFNISEIKMILDSYGINSQHCVDKFDHINALEHCSFVEIVD